MNYEEWIKEHTKYLKENPPFNNNKWDTEILYEYLVYSCCMDTEEYIKEYFSKYTHDENLLKLLFDFLLNDDYDGSDCQMSSAYYIAQMDKTLLEKYSDLLSEAGKNPVAARNPLKYME
ncbi:MAG: hypothetical protein NC205_06780 [Prevotella sp.]|nr:hypothetical protein [Alistipes senegalensis]MCM1358283.1 hypothetical protein [Prevotella sp.]MCM1473335.1 hypothetical protein [Muribaculaceae bacterium]